MNNKSNFLFLVFSLFLLSFSFPNEIASCFISFNNIDGLIKATPERLPETAEKVRQLKTANGDVVVTRIDGYRVLYNNKKDVPFVNLKVELSQHRSYGVDTINLINNLKYLNSHSINMESKDLIELQFNGFKIYGLSRNSIEQGSNLGTFIMFPGNDITVYFYFNNLKPEFRNFESVEEYKVQRDSFIQNYTSYIKTCLNK